MRDEHSDGIPDGSPLPLIPPGEILLEEFMKPLGVSQNRLARDIDAPVSRIAGIVKGERAITADTALRLARFFGTSAEMWLGLQASYDLRVARRAKGSEIEKRVRQLAA
jgi:addiction module HigA family antidote